MSVRFLFNFEEWSPTDGDWAVLLSRVQPEERERLGKFKRGPGVVGRKNPDAKSSGVGRLLMRRAACEILGVADDDLRLARTKTGRPYVVGREGDIAFNASHQGEYVAFAAELGARARLGVDVMHLALPVRRGERENMGEFFDTMRDCFTKREWRHICPNLRGPGTPFSQQAVNLFYTFWALKESYIKAIGIGLGFELQRAEFTVRFSDDPDDDGALPVSATLAVDGKPLDAWRFALTYVCRGEARSRRQRSQAECDGAEGLGMHVVAVCVAPPPREPGADDGLWQESEYGKWDLLGRGTPPPEEADAAKEFDVLSPADLGL